MVARVCLVSSGTGGHLLPAVVLGNALEAHGHSTCLLTEGRPAVHALLDRFACRAQELPLGRGSLRLPLSLPRAALRAREVLRQNGVDVVVATGGAATIPVGLAARSLRLPLCLMEQNATTGRANRLMLPFARRIWLGLPTRAPLPRALLTGTPIRREFGALDKAAAREALGLAPDTPTLFVTGGSQGARALNELVPEALAASTPPLQVVHLTGQDAEAEVRQRYADASARGVTVLVREMTLDMPAMYAAADLVVCRGGGGTVAELMASGRGAIVVPYPHHRDRQQWHNARVLERAGAAVVVEQRQLTAAHLAQLLRDLLRRPDELAKMGQRAGALAPRDACAAIVDDLSRIASL